MSLPVLGLKAVRASRFPSGDQSEGARFGGRSLSCRCSSAVDPDESLTNRLPGVNCWPEMIRLDANATRSLFGDQTAESSLPESNVKRVATSRCRSWIQTSLGSPIVTSSERSSPDNRRSL